MQLVNWQIKWGVSDAAIAELRTLLIGEYAPNISTGEPALSEAAVQNNIRMAASRRGDRLFRNNNGAGRLADGSYVRWGLANDSEAVNRVCKSSDLIGIKKVEITRAHVGQIIGQFWACEVKHSGWRYSGTEREVAQLKFLSMVTALGGCGQFSTGAI